MHAFVSKAARVAAVGLATLVAAYLVTTAQRRASRAAQERERASDGSATVDVERPDATSTAPAEQTASSAPAVVEPDSGLLHSSKAMRLAPEAVDLNDPAFLFGSKSAPISIEIPKPDGTLETAPGSDVFLSTSKSLPPEVMAELARQPLAPSKP
jgi:hypothetical protein